MKKYPKQSSKAPSFFRSSQSQYEDNNSSEEQNQETKREPARIFIRKIISTSE